MAKRKEKPADEGSPAWMTTFSDLMNLLLCFFVLLFASSTVDAEKIQKIAASFNNISFSILETGAVSKIEGQIVSGGVTQLPGIESILEYIGVSSKVEGNNQNLSATGADDGTSDNSDQPDSVKPNTEEMITDNDANEAVIESAISVQELKEKMEEQGLQQSEEMYDEVSQMVESYSIEEKVVLDYNSQYVSLDLNGAILFDGGKAEIRDDAKIFMQKIAAIVEKYKDCVIEIEGHTDNIPIHNSQFESNRYLSTARATKVYEYLTGQVDLIDKNMKVAGYGESRPVASNKTEQGRAKNRRVSVKIYNQLNSAAQTEE